jgi:hypothetical protein
MVGLRRNDRREKTVGCIMLNQDIQNALQELDTRTQKKKNKRVLGSSMIGVVLLVAALGGVWFYKQSVPTVTMDHLSRMIIIASRTSDNDPIRLLGDIEREMGKSVQDLSNRERAKALNYLMSHIDLHHNRKELITY